MSDGQFELEPAGKVKPNEDITSWPSIDPSCARSLAQDESISAGGQVSAVSGQLATCQEADLLMIRCSVAVRAWLSF